MGGTFPGVAAALSGRASQVVDDWLGRYEASPLRVPKPLDRRALAAPARGIVSTLAQAVGEEACGPGTSALRETEKLVAFAGGTFGMSRSTAFDVVAFVMALRDALLPLCAGAGEQAALARLFDWIAAVAVEGYGSSQKDALRLGYRESLERGTPVIMITPLLPAALLVGDPDRSVLDSVFGRLMLAVVRVDAPAVIIDGGGLVSAVAPPVLEALAQLSAHRRTKALLTIFCGLSPAAETEWTTAFAAPARVVCAERFDEAVARGLEVARRA